ncbi:MAG: 30S ribosomal protein S8 [Myxococcales bacterium]|nr:30S ribosomal protein S8 [Myxococcales bacterium]
MPSTDPIADMLTRIRNALLVRKDSVEMPTNKVKHRIAEILKDEGYITDYFLLDGEKGKVLHLDLKYRDLQNGTITGLRRVSKPGRRVYCGAKAIPRVYNGMGIAVMSTPQGVMTGKSARAANVGGEVICEVW